MLITREYHERFSSSKLYLWAIGFCAFAAMVSALIPFEAVLMPAVAVSPHKWKKIGVASAIGSSIGAAVLAAIFGYFGWPLVDRLFPALANSSGLMTAQAWVSRYGALVLIPIAALPIAQAPVLVVAGLLGIKPVGVLASFLIGKTLKYLSIAWLVARGEQRLALRNLR